METVDVTTTDSIRDLVRFPFQDPNWQNRFVIGAALTLANLFVPLLPSLVVSGYALQVMRQAIEGQELSLPPWDDWGGLLLDGLRAALVSLVFLLPGMVVLWAGMGLYFGGIFAVPAIIALLDESARAIPLILLITFGSLAVMFLSLGVGWVLYLAGIAVLPVARPHFVAHGDVRAAFRVREWWPLLKLNPWGYLVGLIVAVGLFGLWYVAVMLLYSTMVLCWAALLLGVPFGFYLSLVTAALFGRIYRESRQIAQAAGNAE